MIRLRPSVISLTMAEIKELERRRLFKKHLEKSMNIDSTHWRQDQLLQEPTPALFTTDLTKAGPGPEGPSYGSDGPPRAVSPASFVSSVNDEISGDEGLLPLRRSRRIQARHHVDSEAEERRPQLEARISRAQRRLQAIRLDPPTDDPANTGVEESAGPSLPVSAVRAPRDPPNNDDAGFFDRHQLTPAVRAPRDPPNNHDGGFLDRGQPHEQGPSGLSLLINDEPSSWPSTPLDPAPPTPQPRSPDQASTSQSDGAQDTIDHGLWPAHEELVSDTNAPESVSRPPSAGGPSSPTLPRTPSRFQIYNDSLPASSQPQTPQNLPEARHRSRMREFWTAPAGAASSRAAPIRTPTTNRVRRLRGHRSPPGLRAPEGFMGLYGGTENIDDSLLFEQASRALESAGP